MKITKVGLRSLSAIAFVLLTSCVRIDESMKLFFPPDLKELQFVQTQFSAFWWNFVIIEPTGDKQDQPNYEIAQKVCDQLKGHIEKELRHVFCGSSVVSAQAILKSYSKDIVYRQKFDTKEEKRYFSVLTNSAIQASFVSDKNLFSMLRYDPFQTWQDYVELSKNNFIDSFEKKNGYLFDSKTARLVIPLQFQLSPQLNNIEPIISALSEFPSAFLVGSHGSTYRNEKQVRDDLSLVSIISGLIFIIFIVFLVLKSRLNTLLLVIPVGIAMGAATLITQWIDGSIHGLTLAFGSGIIGLALDYGLHGAFGSDSKQTWVSNTIGLLTTLSGVCILLLSGIPLIRQMMIFSSIGLAIGFALFYLLFKYYAKFFKIKSIDFYLPQIKGMPWIMAGLVVFGLYGAAKSQMTMDLRKLSFVSEKESDLTTWFFAKNNNEESFLLIKPFNLVSSDIYLENDWAKKNHIEYEGISKYLPALNLQIQNFNSWDLQGCAFFKNKANSDIQKIYSPFIEDLCLKKNQIPSNDFLVNGIKEKPYLNHLIGESHVLSIFSARDENQAKLIQEQYPEAKSLTQALKNFSKALEFDLTWMIPVSLLLTILILALYYRNLKAVFTALLPFFTGLGLYFTVARSIGFDVDLISILGLVMVFGFSIDYGVFSTDVHRHNGTEAEIKNVYSALTFAAITNVLGFFPMLFAGHPVLVHLGSALFYGTVGTYLGTVYGVYPMYMKRRM
ncbi:MAG: MMPL family transporter [Pseudobdellovibrio sp.]